MTCSKNSHQLAINKSKQKLKNLDQNLINLEFNELILIKIFKIENIT